MLNEPLSPAPVVEAAAASFKAGLLDSLLKKKSRLHRTTLEDIAATAPAMAAPVLPEVLQVRAGPVVSPTYPLPCCGHTDVCCWFIVVIVFFITQNCVVAVRGGRTQLEALLLLAALLKTPRGKASKAAGGGGGAAAAAEGAGEEEDEVSTGLRATFSEHGHEVGVALASAVAGGVNGARNAAAHAEIVKAAALVVERVKSRFGSR